MRATLRFLTISVFLFLIAYCGYSQFVRVADRVIVAGYIFDEESSKPLPFVNVYVSRTRIGTITDTTGYFLLSANIKDTLTISSLGYNNKYVVLTDSATDNSKPLIIFMDTKVYELRSVDVIALRRYKQFEYDFTNMKLPDDDYTYATRNFPFKPKDIDYYARTDPTGFGVVLHPITALYNQFSKEGREKRKLDELKQRDALEESVFEKVDIKLVMRITGLAHEDANIFLKWCDFTPEFISNMSEYELITLIKHKYTQYSLRK